MRRSWRFEAATSGIKFSIDLSRLAKVEGGVILLRVGDGFPEDIGSEDVTSSVTAVRGIGKDEEVSEAKSSKYWSSKTSSVDL